LAETIDDDILKSFFEIYGEIEYATVKLDRLSKRSCFFFFYFKRILVGYGFVYFKRSEDLMNVLENSEAMSLHGRPLRIKPAERNCNLVIENLPTFVSEKELEELLLQLGKVARFNSKCYYFHIITVLK
jgi:RNA recognition motif-containing protein